MSPGATSTYRLKYLVFVWFFVSLSVPTQSRKSGKAESLTVVPTESPI